MKTKKRELIEILLSILFVIPIVLGISFLVFKIGIVSQFGGITGLAIHEESDNSANPQDQEIKKTREDALNSLSKAEDIIVNTKEEGINTLRMEDIVIEAQRILTIADKVDLMENEKTSYHLKEKIRRELLITDKNYHYDDVINEANKVSELNERAKNLNLVIKSKEISLSPQGEEYQDEKISIILNELELAFSEERYEEAEELLIELRDEEERFKSERTFFKTLQKSSQSFIRRNWQILLLIVFFIGTIGRISHQKISKRLLINKINKIKSEKKALVKLTKKAQYERYKENKISDLIYKIRTENYKKRLNSISSTLPVLEHRLRKKINKKTNVKKVNKKTKK